MTSTTVRGCRVRLGSFDSKTNTTIALTQLSKCRLIRRDCCRGQCKAWTSGPVGVSTVRELWGVAHHEKGDPGAAQLPFGLHSVRAGICRRSRKRICLSLSTRDDYWTPTYPKCDRNWQAASGAETTSRSGDVPTIHIVATQCMTRRRVVDQRSPQVPRHAHAPPMLSRVAAVDHGT
jgi:hypothetical protein